MIYLKNFTLLNERKESYILGEDRRNIYNNTYPLHIFSDKSFENINFANITIFYGGNGSGKSTLLNIIAQRIEALRKSNINKGSYFDLYVKSCDYDMAFERPIEIKLITSDDVFDYLLDVRSINARVNRQKEFLSKEYLDYKFNKNIDSFDNYDELRKQCATKRETMSKYVRERLGNNNLNEWSNGESALMFWQREIKESSIYILDEPENSLSAENQLKLKKFIEESVRFYNCQFIISSHSPFLLKLGEAKIYDLDENPVTTKSWTELPNVLMYYNFFKEHEKEFNKK